MVLAGKGNAICLPQASLNRVRDRRMATSIMGACIKVAWNQSPLRRIYS
jgi:hypothetical protein